VATTQPPDDWPGLEAERDGVQYDAEKIAKIAQAMREIMEPISGLDSGRHFGSKQDLDLNGSFDQMSMQLRSIDLYESGDVFARLLEVVHREFLEVYQDVLDNFSTAIALVDAGAGNYSMTDIANQGV